MTNAVLPDPTFSDRAVLIEKSLPPLLLASKLITPGLDLKPLSHFRMQKGVHLLQEVGPIPGRSSNSVPMRGVPSPWSWRTLSTIWSRRA